MHTTPFPRATLIELKARFDEWGYCVANGLWTDEEIQEIETFFEDYKSMKPEAFDGNRALSEIDPTKTMARALHPHRFSRRAQGWLLNPRVAEVLEVLLGKPPLAVQSIYYFKPPGARGQGMHQDNMYLVARPATCIAAWTAIDDATVENGCLQVSPRSNYLELICPEEGKSERWQNYSDSHITKFPRDMKPVPVPVRRGQTLFFGGNLIHGSGPNRTKDRSRRTFIGHYADEATTSIARYYHPVLNMQGEVISNIEEHKGGGPCGENNAWYGAVH